ncbi:hypothetical protein BX666DRAFT_1891720 [Dichotomocladium elegans]|nr:hypothetical protein BX666DRAFT_1891720 [Dichotomocladium elegans]
MFRIVVATDDTPASRKATSYALRLHESIPGSSLQVILAVGLNPTRRGGEGGIQLLDSLDRTNNLDIQHDATATENAIRQRLPTGTDFQVLVQEGEDAKIIEGFINQNPPDMLVLGSSNKTGLERWVLGSVSDHCIHHCRCPVTIIKI